MERKGQINMHIEFINKSKTFFKKAKSLFIIVCFSLLSIAANAMETVLTEGDIAFTRINIDDESFSFVFLVPIENNTQFVITDETWNASDTQGNSESKIRFTATSPFAAGEEISISATTMSFSSSGSGTATITSIGAFSPTLGNMLGSAGDSLFIFQPEGTPGANDFVAGINANSGSVLTPGDAWQIVSTTSTSSSGLPSGLTNGTDALGLFPFGALQVEVDNARYKSSVSFPSAIRSGDKATVLAAIMNLNNWEFDNFTPWPAIGTSFAITGGVVSPTVTAASASSITTTSATLGGNVTSDGGATVTERGIVYSTSDTTPTIAEGATKDTNGSGAGVFSETVSSLTAGTTYYINSYAINSEGTSYGAVQTFTTSAIVAGSLNGSSVTSVELTQTTTVDGSDHSLDAVIPQATYSVEFELSGGTENMYLDVDDNKIVLGMRNSTSLIVDSLTFNFSGGTFGSITGASFNSGASTGTNTTGVSASFTATSVTISGLLSKDFSQGFGLGVIGTVVFDISATGIISTAPTVTTTAASSLTTTSATLGGNVTNDGGATVTERGIVYSTSDTTPTIAEGATKDTNGSGTGAFFETVSSLSSGTTYYYNSYAINSEGTSYGTATSFTTSIPIVTLGLSGSPLAENGGVATVIATLNTVSSQTVTVTIAATGTATGSGTDYNLSSTTITILAGATAGTATITGADDFLDEAVETVIVDIIGVANGTESGTQQVTASITDDDAAPTVTLSLSGSPLAENAGVATITASLNAASSKNVVVTINPSGTATGSGIDYTLSSSTITIAAGATFGTATVTGADDAIDESNETIIIDITGVANGTESGTQQVTATITDDDAAPTVAFASTTSSGLESVNSKNLTVNLSAASSNTITVAYTVTGSATGSGIDYILANGTLTYSAGQTSKTITIAPIIDDVLDEADETVIVTLSSPTNGTLGTNTAHTYTITDNDAAPTVTLGLSGSPLAENGGVATITATLSTASSKIVTVTINSSGTATGSGTDYTLSSTTIIINAGATTGTATITGDDDALDESAETVIIDITGVSNGTESGTQQVTASITDDDAAPAVTLGLSGSPFAENGGVATVTATLNSASSKIVTVTIGATGTATGSGTDYTLSSTTISIPAGSTSGTATITGVDDAIEDPLETVIVDISGVANGTESGTQQVTATITDDESALIAITISANAQSKIAGDADPTLTYQLTSGALESGDTFTGNLSRSAGESAGSYIIGQGSVQAGAKYDITYISATFTISPKPVNHAPVISGSPATTVAKGTAYRFSPTVTDSDAGDSKRFSITNKPTWALFNTASGALTGTPAGNDIGKTSGIVISVRDSGNKSASLSAFNIEVTSTNTLPVATSKSVDVQEDSEVSITLEGSDADNDELTFIVTQEPTHGSLSLSSASNATWLYKADENYNGSDEFSYQVKDKEGSSEPALVSITIAPINDKPLAEDDNVTLNFNEVGSYTIDVLANDSDVDGDTLAIVSASANIGSVTVENNQLVYQLNGAIQGGIQLSYLIDDGSGKENSRAKASASLLIEGDVNTQLPIITLPDDIEFNADALFTKIDLGVATAVGKNGEIVPVSLVDGLNMFKPGNNLAYWKAVDEDGLEQTATQKVKVQPLITIGKDSVGAEGQHYSVGVYLNGTAPDYPVVVPYTVSGSTDENDHLLTSGELVITQGVEGVIDIETLVDDLDEDSETLIITLTGEKNLGSKLSFTLTLIEGNIAPELSYSVTQQDEQRLLIEANSADVVIQSIVIDANASDTHTYTWQSPDGQLSDIDINENSFTFATTDLAEGIYQVTLAVTDDGVPAQSTSTVIYLEVTAALATLTDADSDGDLIPDNQEGFGDADLDGIPDYLDGANPCNVMPQQALDSQSFLVEGDSGVCLRKGLTVASNKTGGILLQGSEVAPDEEADNVGGLFDFVAYGLPLAGQSYNLVLPQRLPIPEGAVYRKYKTDGDWIDFVVDDNNYYSSSAGELGFCPPPLDTTWVKGLQPGDWCVQITIEDGGPNDDDGKVNNTIVDPSGVAVLLNSNTQPSVTSQQLTLAWNTSITIDVLSSATDVDGDLLTISSANVDFGEVLIEGENLVYTPAESFFGEVIIHFGVDDAHSGTAYGTVEINVIENQLPQATNDEVSTDDVSTIIIDVLANDSDDDADTLTILTADAEHGVVSITEKNTLSYTSLAGYDGIDMIAYTISDGHDGSADAQVKVTVTALEATVDKNKSGGGSFNYFLLLLSGLAFKVRGNRGFFI